MLKSLRDLLPTTHPDHSSKHGSRDADPEFARVIQEDAAAEVCCPYAPTDTDDLPGQIRHLKGSHPEMTYTIQEATNRLAGMVRNKWQETFGGPLKVDFVCVNPDKMALLRATMEISDLVPLIYGIADTDGPHRLRVVIEI